MSTTMVMPTFRTSLLLIGCLLTVASMSAQNNAQRTVVEFDLSKGTPPATHVIPLADVSPFLAYTVYWEADDWDARRHHWSISFSPDGENWSETEELELDPHRTFRAPQFISNLYFAAKEMRFFRLEIHSSDPAYPAEASRVKVNLFSPGNTGPVSAQTVSELPDDRAVCFCTQPEFLGRDQWCQTGDCPVDATPVITTVTHLIVHHSAGPNSSSDWAAVVHSIWNGHVNDNGWDDIGYNWLIDPNGVLYEGRADNIQGAHFCGYNGGTMGVCMMGTYSTVGPTEAAKETLRQLLAWKSCKEDIDPLDFSFHASSGLNLFHISGHRDGCATECPGQILYDDLPQIREQVNTYIETVCSSFPPPTELAAEVVTDDDVDLIWLDNSDNETAFQLVRASGNGTFAQIAELPAGTTTYQDLDLTPGVYRYRVRAITDQDTSAFSNVAKVDILSVSTTEVISSAILFVFPNPANDQITLQIEQAPAGTTQLDLFAADGRRVRSWTFETQTSSPWTQTVSVASLPAGIYWLELQTSNQVFAARLQVQ